MIIENFIAIRYLIKGKSSKNITSASLIAISVIALAIVFFISSVSIMNGYIIGLMKLAIEVKSAHIKISGFRSYTETKTISENLALFDDIKFAGLFRETKALLSANTKNTGIFYFRSIEENSFEKDTGFDQCIKLIDGKKSLLNNEIMISLKTASKLKIKCGDIIFLLSFISKETPTVTLYKLKVSGIFSTGYNEIDEQLTYIGNKTGDKIFKNELPYDILIKLKDYKKAPLISNMIKYKGYNVIENWMESNYNEFTALNFEKNIIAFIVIIALFVAVLNILTTIFIIINEKNKDIGILKAIGFSPKSIKIIFILYSVYLGFIGIIIGIISGLLIMHSLNGILNCISSIINLILRLNHLIISKFKILETFNNFEFFSKDFYLDKIYTDISLLEILFIALLTFIFSLLSSIIPAISTGKVKPIEVIKNG